MEDRLIELEIKFMEQNNSIESLSQAIYAQQKGIQSLQDEIAQLTRRLQSLSSSNIRPESEETPPPHY